MYPRLYVAYHSMLAGEYIGLRYDIIGNKYEIKMLFQPGLNILDTALNDP